MAHNTRLSLQSFISFHVVIGSPGQGPLPRLRIVIASRSRRGQTDVHDQHEVARLKLGIRASVAPGYRSAQVIIKRLQ